MPIINRSEFPADHTYYRTTSPVYNKYLRDHCHIRTIALENGTRFGWVKRLLGKYLQLVKFERIDIEPTKELLKSHGFVRGFAIWIPFRRTDIPPGWRKLAIGTHFTRTGFTHLENNEYYKKWNERSRRARKKFLSFPESEVRIELVNEETFVKAFKSVRVKHMFKSDYIRYYRAMMEAGSDSVRSYVAYRGDTPVAGLAVHDYGNKRESQDVSTKFEVTSDIGKNDEIREGEEMRTTNKNMPDVGKNDNICMKSEDLKESYDLYGEGKAETLNTKMEVVSHIPNASVHLVAFTGKTANPFQAGTGLIDRWFADSVDLGIEYMNFDHLRDASMPRDQQGYTDFKLNFMEKECYFRDSYFRFL